MSEIPEIDAVRGCRWFARPETIVTDEQRAECEEVVHLDDAESAIRSALDRQAREIVEALRADADEYHIAQDRRFAVQDAADLIERRFAPKEADPR